MVTIVIWTSQLAMDGVGAFGMVRKTNTISLITLENAWVGDGVGGWWWWHNPQWCISILGGFEAIRT